MTKPKIYATGNESLSGEFNVSYYIVEKDENFLDWLAKLLVEVLEIREGNKKVKFWEKPISDLPEDYELVPKEIDKLVDYHESYSNKGERVDVFYGLERVYLTFRKSKEVRQKFAKFLLKTREWIKLAESDVVEIGKRIGKPTTNREVFSHKR